MERLKTILNNLGLDDVRAAVFIYLAGKRRATLEEIYEDTALSRKAVSMALEALEAEGAVKKDGMAFTVENVREALMAMLPARYEEVKAEIYSYRPAVVKKETPGVEAFWEEEAALPPLAAKEIDAALQDIVIVSRSLAWLDEESLNAARAAVQRGVKVRVITKKHPELRADARALTDAGVEVRCHDYADSVDLMIVDGGFMVLSIRGPPGLALSAYFRLMIRDRGACERARQHIFEMAWKNAASIGALKSF